MLALIPLTLVLCACSTPGPVTEKGGAVVAEKPVVEARFPFESIRKGMTEQQLRAAFGEPTSIEPLKGADPKARLWTYRRDIVKEYRDVLAGTREVPVWAGLNATSGNSVKMVQEPITRQELHVVTELTFLLVLDGKCVEHKQRFQETNSFVN